MNNLSNMRFLGRAILPSTGFYWQQHVQVVLFGCGYIVAMQSVCLLNPCQYRGCGDRYYCWYVDFTQTTLQVIFSKHSLM